MDIKIPKLGEGVSSGTVVSVLVKPGDTVKKDQTVLELETEKAVAPIPASSAGVVSKILVKEGDVVSVGQSIIALSGNGVAAPAETPKAAAPASVAPKTQERQTAQPVNVSHSSAQSADFTYHSPSGVEPPASPSIRKMARDLGIDLRKVRGSEHGGRIVLADLRDYVQKLQSGAFGVQHAASSEAPVKPKAESIDFSKWGPVTKKAVSSLRKTIGQKMVESWTAIPHVTQFDEADISAMMELRKKYVAAYEKKGANLTVTTMMLKVIVAALKKYPVFNSSLDEVTGELVYKNYFHLGVAVDTEAGLIVPVLRDVDQKSVLDLSKELAVLAEKTRQRKVSMDELQGGSFTISNLGSIGGSYFTPIVNKPQVAILGVARGVTKPVFIKSEAKGKTKSSGEFEPRVMLPLALSYDHRVIDGADGARFVRELVSGLENFNEKDVRI